ncbi:MAG: ATP-grasp domain-containing protein [Candidatus Eisenbacteria bacterium]|uniref:ATP-grasp domain-containing protein n=1 Tax=Eiseniibacteriota bacterium TaxID=2212470 RepID=A0A538T5U2_UNCEI|nr:MAG: ATP-grasp domain-containing protein [Candidatus Eisenbacteria bacterium]
MESSSLRIGVLYDEWAETKEPAVEPKPADVPKRKRRRDKPDREEVFEALVKKGHQPAYFCLDGRPKTLKALASAEVDLMFNYTGSGPGGLHLAQDKAVAKRLFAFHGIRTPNFATVYQGRLQWADDVHFPVIVKPKREDGSIGIAFSAVAGSIKELMERIDALHADLNAPVLIEEYIEGRELYVSVIGNDPPVALPVIELNLDDLPEGTPRIAGTEVKWERGTAAYRKTKLRFPEDLSENLLAEIQETAVKACQVLEIRDYARVDFRLSPKRKFFTLEVNPNPWLHSTAEFALAAKQSGREHADVIQEIVDLALARYRGISQASSS